MKKEVNPLVIGVVIVVLVAVIGYFGWRTVSPSPLSVGNATPGVPPWMDKKNADGGQAPVNPGLPPQPGNAGLPSGAPSH